MATEKRYAKKTKAQQFVDGMTRYRSNEFAKIGMMVKVDGDFGTIVGMNSSANLDVQFANQLQNGKRTHNYNPTWRVKHFDAEGKVIVHYDECNCVLRPIKKAV